MPRIVDVEQVYCSDCEYKGKCETMIDQKTLFCDVPSMPTIDAVPVVRCKDCKHLGIKDFAYGYCKNKMCGIIKPNDFCSYGERKDDT